MKQIHHVVDIDSQPGLVWEALTTDEGLAGWWTSTLSSDGPGVGSRTRFTFGGDFNPVMEVTGAEEGYQLEWLCVDGHKKWQDNTFTFQLVDAGGGRCRLRFSQHYAVELNDDDYGSYNFNWGCYLESLRLLCTTGKGKPFHPAEH